MSSVLFCVQNTCSPLWQSVNFGGVCLPACRVSRCESTGGCRGDFVIPPCSLCVSPRGTGLPVCCAPASVWVVRRCQLRAVCARSFVDPNIQALWKWIATR